MTSKSSGHELFQRIGKTHRWVALSSLLGIITIGSGIGLLAMAIYLLTRSAVLGTAASLSLTILGVRFFALTRVVGRYCERYLGHLGTFRVLSRLRVWLFEHLIATDSIILADQRRGDLVTGLVDDVDTMQDRLLRVSSPPFVAFGTLAIALVALLAIDVRSAVILALFFLVGALGIPPLLWSQTRQLSAQLIRLRANRLAEATELFDGLETLKIWGRTDQLSESIAYFDTQEIELTRKLARTRSLLDVAVMGLAGLCVLTIVAALRTTDASTPNMWWITTTPLIALAAFEALSPLLAAPDYRAQTDAAAGRILTMATPTTITDPPVTTEQQPFDDLPRNPEIEISNLSFSYGDHAPLFRNASLTIPFGATVAIAAPSGTGKSTLLQLLVGLLPCPEGSISIGGHQTADLLELPRPCIAAVMQDDHVFDTTVRDNLLVGDGDATDQQLLDACAIAGFQQFLDTRPGGLDAPIGANGELLSGGERQRLMIARAVLANSPILILDEATEHLEPELRSSVIDEVIRSRRNRTTVILAHDIDALTHADVVYDIVDGAFMKRQP
jgi:ATP-binding cassette, subfamily C, bacterial CydC